MRSCSSCGVDVDGKRLEAKPNARLCRDCQDNKEQKITPKQRVRGYVNHSTAFMFYLNTGGPNLKINDTLNDLYEKMKERNGAY